MTSKPEALIFDLFGTLVFFDDSRVPTMEVAGRRVPSTIARLPELLAEVLPGVGVADFLRHLGRVGLMVREQKVADGTEIHSSVRFQRTLVELGAATGTAEACGREMAVRHMNSLAQAVVCPPNRSSLLEQLSRTYRLALLSNFDDGATARRVLDAAGLSQLFERIVISDEEGIRKPSAAIFERTCAHLSLKPGECLYTGDTLIEDIHGATGAGLHAVWIHQDQAMASPARAILHDVEALPDWLATGFSAPDVA